MNAMQMDWVGEAPRSPRLRSRFPDKRPLIAARKAELALQIEGSASGEPRGCIAGQRAGCVRAWFAAVEVAKKAVGSRTSSVVGV